jgi:hypothetical protein
MLCSSARGCSFGIFGCPVFELLFEGYKEAVSFGFAQLLCKQLLLRLAL